MKVGVLGCNGYKNCEYVTWTDELHTKLTGSIKIQGISC